MKRNFFVIVFIVVMSIVVYSCDTVESPNPLANTINGTIFFADTNFTTSGGSYNLFVYDNNDWPLAGTPVYSNTINISKDGNNAFITEYQYTTSEVPSGSYVVSVIYQNSGNQKVLGIFGCDTSHSLTCYNSPSRLATIVTTEGLRGIDILSWADTSQQINP